MGEEQNEELKKVLDLSGERGPGIASREDL
jgi:hypothetical protein